MMIKLVIDMNLSPDWVEVFVQAGIQCRHWADIGAVNAPDHEIMGWAQAHDHVVFTHDLDFGALLASSGKSGPSVIQIRSEDTRPATMGAIVVAAVLANLDDLNCGALVTVHPNRMRTRVLPLIQSQSES